MLDLIEVNNTIKELENGQTSYDTCMKLASLYIVRQEFDKSNEVISELKEILPQYKKYRSVKQKYQMREISSDLVHLSMQDLCNEIIEFIETLYNNTDTPFERDMLKNMAQNLGEIIINKAD